MAIAVFATGAGFWWFYINNIKPAIADRKLAVGKISGPFSELSGYLKGANYDDAIVQLTQETRKHGEALAALIARGDSVTEKLDTHSNNFTSLNDTVNGLAGDVRALKTMHEAVQSRIQEATSQLEAQLGSLRADLTRSIAEGDVEAQGIAAKATVETLKVRLTLSRTPTGAGDPNIERDLDRAESLLRELEGKLANGNAGK